MIGARGGLGSLALLVTLGAGCSEPPAGSPTAAAGERGRQIYLAQCTACHAADPAQAGPLGPAVKGSTPELLEAKIVRGAYPDGYRPKRPTQVMPAQPALAAEIGALAEYLK